MPLLTVKEPRYDTDMIILAATPIGNLGDASPRLREAFETARVIAAEDTRHTAQLLRLLDIKNRPELIALHDHNEQDRAPSIAKLALKEDIVVVSDAGMPTVSDPGFRLVQEAHRVGATVTVIPGPSAVMTALAVSGLPTDRFTFEGFVPKREGERLRALAALADEPRTMVFFESPHRVAATLGTMATVFGNEREAAVCRELTKLHEEVRRGTVQELADWAEEGLRGEIALVVAGASPPDADPAAALAKVLDLVAGGMRLKEAARFVAQAEGLSVRDLYEAALDARDQSMQDKGAP